MATDEELHLSFDPHTIEHLGSNMYSRLPNAVAELVANAYDADATRIEVRVVGTGDEQKIVVDDDGHGMSRSDLRDKYLRIGRNRRGGDATGRSESGRRTVSGKKGLGKLALFGIGHRVVVTTSRVGAPERFAVAMDWDELLDTRDGDYRPDTTTELGDVGVHGTSVEVSRLTRASEISPPDLAVSLARLFQYSDGEVELVVVRRDGQEIPITRELRLDSIESEFKWRISENLVATREDAEASRPEAAESGVSAVMAGFVGAVVAAEKPLPTQMRGITVYANGRLANEPEFFGASDSSYAYAYLTGYVSIDSLDAIEPDVVATDRRAVNWEHPDAAVVRERLQRMVEEIALDRRRQRKEKNKQDLMDETGVDPDTWVDTIKGPERRSLRELIDIIGSEDTDMSDEVRGRAVKSLKELAPPYADLVWRHLHPSIQEASTRYFETEDYHQALVEGCKAYVADLRVAAGMRKENEASLFGKALGENGSMQFTYAFTGGVPAISGNSADNLENGQRDLAKAIWSAFRNPLSHEPLATIRELDVITHHDCLDALSLMSHLRRRLDVARPKTEG